MNLEKGFNGQNGLRGRVKRVAPARVDDQSDLIVVVSQSFGQGGTLIERNEAVAIAVNQ